MVIDSGRFIRISPQFMKGFFMRKIFYYKIINDITGLVEWYVSVDVPVQDDKVCEVLGIAGHHAESIKKEEFDRQLVDEEILSNYL